MTIVDTTVQNVDCVLQEVTAVATFWSSLWSHSKTTNCSSKTQQCWKLMACSKERLFYPARVAYDPSATPRSRIDPKAHSIGELGCAWAKKAKSSMHDWRTGWPKKVSHHQFFKKKIALMIANEIRFLRKVNVWIKHYNIGLIRW